MKLQKITSQILMICLVGILFSACRKDLGNYKYQEINELEVSGINDNYDIQVGGMLNIVPVLGFSKDPNFSPDNYSYEWISFNESAAQAEQRKSLYKGQNFDIPFALGIGTYSVFYVVTEKSTGVSWRKRFIVKVTGTYKGGWGVLSEVNGGSRLDYFQYDHATVSYPKVYRDFTSQFADAATGQVLKLEGKPKFLAGWSNRVAAVSGYKYYFYVGTETQTNKINLTDGNWKDSYPFKFESAGATALTHVDNIMPALSGDGYAFLDGDVFVSSYTFNMAFGTPINRLTGNTAYFKVSPYVAVIRGGVSANALMYDVTNKRFVRNVNAATTSVSPLTYTAGTSPFNPNAVGMDLVWMGQTYAYGGRAYAVLKDGSKYYLARMNNAAAFSAYAWDEITNITDIANAEHFAVDQQYGYLHYSVGGKVYQYDVDSKTSKLMKDYGNLKISMLKVNQGVSVTYSTAVSATNAATYGKRFIPVVTGLICATYDPANPNTSGKVDIFMVPQFNAPFTIDNSFDGFGKVVDVCSAEIPLGW